MQTQWWLRYSLCLFALILAHLAYGGYFSGPPTQAESKFDGEAITQWIQQVLDGKPTAPPDWLKDRGIAWADGYREGRLSYHQSGFSQTRETVLREWLSPGSAARLSEALEIGVASQVLDYGQQEPPRAEKGLWGLYLTGFSHDLSLAPNEFARSPRTLQKTFQHYQQSRGVLRARKFRGPQWLIRNGQATPIVRGEALIPLAEVTPQRIQQAAIALGRFEGRLVRQNYGHFPYRFQVLDGKPSEQERILVRNVLGTWSLANFAKWTGKDQDREVALLNIKTTVGRFGHWVDDAAYIADREFAFLGSQAFVALAILNLPQPPADLLRWERGIAQAILKSVRKKDDGYSYFVTTLPLPGLPPPDPGYNPEKDPNQDFFPGETLTYLAAKARQDPAGPWLDTYDQVFPTYRQRFRRIPHPAAVPWLAQACVQRYRCDKSSEARDFAFEVVDWHLDNLQPFAEMDPFLRGSPINPNHKRYGPVSATSGPGVQLEGLVEAYWLARVLDDKPRQQRYQSAILETSRYLIQMQYRDPEELYWLAPALRAAPQGGLRDMPWDHRIQSDSAAHALNAWVHYLESLR